MDEYDIVVLKKVRYVLMYGTLAVPGHKKRYQQAIVLLNNLIAKMTEKRGEAEPSDVK